MKTKIQNLCMDTIFIERCLQLAKLGEGHTSPNPMVGAVIVHNEKIIGEGFHKKCGGPHAEVNAVNSVQNQELFPESTIYVSLEPCSHFGKTPPCANLIIEKKIKRVVIAATDPNPKVSGRGIQLLKDAGIEVVSGVLERESKDLNRAFFTNQIQKRPYIILKWAESKDGFLDRNRQFGDNLPPARISNFITQTLTHKLRARVDGILVGTNTALLDNPKLDVRFWNNNHPVRILFDKTGKVPHTHSLFDGTAKTIVLEQNQGNRHEISFIGITNENSVSDILNRLFELGIYSVLVEGGADTLNRFIKSNLWDEAFIEKSKKIIGGGVKAPTISLSSETHKKYFDSHYFHLKNEISRNFI